MISRLKFLPWVPIALLVFVAGCTTVAPTADVGADDQPPRVLIRRDPQYPVEMKKRGMTGTAVVEFIIDSEGHVTSARAVAATHEAFARSAVACIEQWKFRPGRKGGRNVATRMQLPMYFDLSQVRQ